MVAAHCADDTKHQHLLFIQHFALIVSWPVGPMQRQFGKRPIHSTDLINVVWPISLEPVLRKLSVNVFKNASPVWLQRVVRGFHLKSCFNWKNSGDGSEFTYMRSAFFLPEQRAVTSLLSLLFPPWLCDSFLQVISPGLEKQSIQSRLREKRRKKKNKISKKKKNKTKRFERKSLQKLLGIAGEEKKA